jgi:hypothetical protein
VWCPLSEVATVSVVTTLSEVATSVWWPQSVRWPQLVWCTTTLSEVAAVWCVPYRQRFRDVVSHGNS